VIAAHPELDIKLFTQPGTGKADAVRFGFDRAAGDLLMILDADLTVPPEFLVRCYDAALENRGELIIGSRLVYPLEKQAMRFLNIVGNRIFSLLFSWLLNQKLKDTLCGTKVLLRSDWEKIKKTRAFFGDFDPFGDFELIFGAARQNLKLLEIPVRYRDRTYGVTNIRRFAHGWLLLKMFFFALWKMKMR
jgi:glycosyltransferase involved in cell wall biosynthesis